MRALLAEFLIPFLIHVNRNQRVSWGRRVIEPRQVDDRNQGKVFIQYSNVSTKAHAEKHSDFQASGVSRTRILSRLLAGRKIFRNMFRKGLSPVGNRPGPGPARDLRPRMTYHHTVHGTGNRFGTIEERRARSYFRPNTWKFFQLSIHVL